MSKTSYQPDPRFQNSVLETDLMYPTATPGTPGAGAFYSTIPNRAPIVDLRKDLKPRIGIERIMTQQIVELQNESGPNGEKVFGALNDSRGLIRFVGGWSALSDTNGSRPNIPSTSDLLSYIEVIFYGTGLNLLSVQAALSNAVASVDGGAEGSNLFAGALSSSVLVSRNYSLNQHVQVVSGLSAGVHTVKIRKTDSYLNIYGFEILNESSAIKTNPGNAIVDGRKVSLLNQNLSAYNSGFTNVYGTAGAKGGHVLKYMDAYGTIKKDIQYADVAIAYLASANHSNEEVIRTYNIREFAAGRSDDFSSVFASPVNRAFTLDDGLTTLTGKNVVADLGGPDIRIQAVNGSFLLLTFIGTGLDLNYNQTIGVEAHHIYVDGVAAGVLSLSTLGAGKAKICSGLSYGTHTVKIQWETGDASSGNTAYRSFVVYGPKKPVLPSNCLELAEYYLMANYVASVSAGLLTVASGVMRKYSSREGVYVGTWNSVILEVDSFDGGQNINTTTSGSYVEYTFWGTGIEIAQLYQPSVTYDVRFTLDGSTDLRTSNPLWPSIVTSWTAPGSGITWTNGPTASLAGLNATGGRGRLRISGLSLGKHTIRMATNNGTQFYSDAFDIITPIHVPKSNLYGDIQNTLPVGSCSICDSRNASAVKENESSKSWAQAMKVSTNPSTTSAVDIPVPDMSVTIKTKGNHLEIKYNLVAIVGTSAGGAVFQFYVDGIAVGQSKVMYQVTSILSCEQIVSDSLIVPATEGFHKVDVYWRASGGGGSSITVESRTLSAKEI